MFWMAQISGLIGIVGLACQLRLMKELGMVDMPQDGAYELSEVSFQSQGAACSRFDVHRSSG
jgi:hypothetical protein